LLLISILWNKPKDEKSHRLGIFFCRSVKGNVYVSLLPTLEEVMTWTTEVSAKPDRTLHPPESVAGD
jgi:hypothetical protein